MLKGFHTTTGKNISLTLEEVDLLSTCKSNSYVVGDPPMIMRWDTYQATEYIIYNLDKFTWNNIRTDAAKIPDGSSLTIILNKQNDSTNKVTYKYQSSEPNMVLDQYGEWLPLESSGNITFTAPEEKGESPYVILGTTPGYTNISKLKITSGELQFNNLMFNNIDLTWHQKNVQHKGSLILSYGGTVPDTSMAQNIIINCHGDLETNHFCLTYSKVSVDGSLTLDDWAYGKWPVINPSTQVYTELSVNNGLILKNINRKQTNLKLLGKIPTINDFINALDVGSGGFEPYYSIGELSPNDNNVLDISINIFSDPENFGPFYTINEVKNRMFYYIPGVNYTFTLKMDMSHHPVGFASDTSWVKEHDRTNVNYNINSDTTVPYIPELSHNTQLLKGIYYLPNNTEGFLDISFKSSDKNIFLINKHQGFMESPLVLIPKSAPPPTPTPPLCDDGRIDVSTLGVTTCEDLTDLAVSSCQDYYQSGPNPAICDLSTVSTMCMAGMSCTMSTPTPAPPTPAPPTPAPPAPTPAPPTPAPVPTPIPACPPNPTKLLGVKYCYNVKADPGFGWDCSSLYQIYPTLQCGPLDASNYCTLGNRCIAPAPAPGICPQISIQSLGLGNSCNIGGALPPDLKCNEVYDAHSKTQCVLANTGEYCVSGNNCTVQS